MSRRILLTYHARESIGRRGIDDRLVLDVAAASDGAVKAKWAALLKQYCALDTLSMVLIFESWRRLVGPA